CTALAAAVPLAVGLSTPPHSGPGCVSGCLAYPYTDAARYVPGDFWWLYPASLTALLAVVILAILANRRSPDARIAGWLGRALSVIAAAILVTDYAIQLTVVQPGLLTGQTDGLVLLTQYNPLGVYIALENVGYLLLGIAF